MAETTSADNAQISETQTQASGRISELLKAGRIKLTTFNKAEACLDETNVKVLLEITGAKMNKHIFGVDIVTVLDVNGSGDDKKTKLKEINSALKFLINKLSDDDRLSLITFCKTSIEVKTSLLPMNEQSKIKIEGLVDNLEVVDESLNASKSATDNVVCGLQTALQQLNGSGCNRVSAIMLVMGSCTPRTKGGSGIQIPQSNVPVYTFGLGPNHDEELLYQIANKSTGGTFSTADIEDKPSSNNLTYAFSQCLAGLLTISVQELNLTITTINSTIVKVSTGSYSTDWDEDIGFVRICFGNLSSDEKRRVIVDIVLPAVSNHMATDALNITYTYNVGESSFEETKPLVVTINRIEKPLEQEKEEVKIEVARLQTVATMQKAREIADNGNLDGAQDELVKAQNMLEDVVNKRISSLEMLKSELFELLKYMQSTEIYTSLGRALSLVIQTSHDRQRFAARSDAVHNQRIFATSFMDKFLKQVITYLLNPTARLPTIMDDFKEEIAKNPIHDFPIAALTYYLEQLIKSMQAIQDKINSIPGVEMESM